MTKLFKYYLSATLVSLITFTGYAQLITEDISTGHEPSGLTTVTVQDFHWDVMLPDGSWSDAFCSSGVPDGPSNPNGNQYAGLDPAVRFISPFITSTGTGNLRADAMEGEYQYRMYFHINTCIIDSPVLVLNHVGADDRITEININGVAHNVNFGFNPFTNNTLINLGSGELLSGVNTVIIKVQNDGGFTGMELNAAVTYLAGPLPSLEFRDQFGNVKDSYCLGEDVFIDAPGAVNKGFHLTLSDITPGSTWGPIIYTNNGQVNGLNVTNLYANHPTTPVTFLQGHTYKLTMELLGTGSCHFTAEKQFTYTCCESSYDPTFWVKVGYNQLQTQPAVTLGTHTWQVYQIPAGNLGSYTLLGTFNGPTFNYDTYGGCFYITHTISNVCGTSCNGQIVCGPDCSAKLCNLTQPKHLQFNNGTNIISWDEVPGAAYELEIIVDDPACCGNPNWDYVFDSPNEFGNISYKSPKIISLPVGQFSYHVNFLNEFGVFLRENCFSYKVTAICPDGGRISSPKICSWSSPDDPDDNPDGKILPGKGNGTAADRKDKTGVVESKQYEAPEVNIFPNPSKGIIDVNVSASHEISFSVSIFDAKGSVVKIYENMKTSNGRSNLKVYESLPKGTYMVKITTSENQVTDKKLVIE